MDLDAYPLHKACRDGDVQNVIIFLNHNKCLLSTEDSYKNWSPIHWAAYCGHLHCLSQVAACDHNALNLQSSKTFQTPLHCAAEGGHPQCVLWLLQAGVNPEVKDNFSETALHKASRNGSAECVSILLAATINICTQNANGLTASMLADLSGHRDLANYIRQREIAGINVFQNGRNLMTSFPVAPRINRKRLRDSSDIDNSFKRQRSLDNNETLLSPFPVENIFSVTTSEMEHQDLCGSEMQYSNSYEYMLREFHGC